MVALDPAPTRVIVNPAAGGGRTVERAAALRPRLESIFGALDWHVSASAAQVTALARAAAQQGHPRVVVVGGDGTVHFAAGAVAETQTALAIVPLGTGNDAAAAFGVPRDPGAALTLLAQGRGHVRTVDVGRVGDRVFVCLMGIGLDTPAIEFVESVQALPRSRLLYTYAALRAIVTYRPRRLRIYHAGGFDERPVAFAAAANTHGYAGGMRICPAARVDDGRLDLCVIEGLWWPRLLLRFRRVRAGRHAGLPGVTLAQSPWIRFESREPLPVTLDGELTDLLTPVEARVLPGALRILGPAA